MDMNKIKTAAEAIRGDVVADFAMLAHRDRRALEAVSAELGMDKSDATLAHIGHALMSKGITLMDEFPKMKYRLREPVDDKPVPPEQHIVNSAEEEAALPNDGKPWMDTPTMPVPVPVPAAKPSTAKKTSA